MTTESHLDELRERASSLERANAFKDEFLAIVSHELRSPLAQLVPSLELASRRLRDGGSLDDALTALEEATAGARRLEELVRNLILLAQLEGGQEVEGEPVSFDRIAEQVVREFQQLYPERSIELSTENEPVIALGVEVYVRQIVENLLSNALKYSPAEQPVSVTVRSRVEPTIVVVDRGRGLAPGEEETVFENFYRGPGAGETAKGLGVGLTVCRRLTEVMGGAIWAERLDDGGTAFGFRLPAAS